MKIESISTTLIEIPYQAGAPTQPLGGQTDPRIKIIIIVFRNAQDLDTIRF